MDVVPPPPPPDPAQAFMWGAQGLFSGLHALNERLARVETALGSDSRGDSTLSELASLRAFAQSVYAQLLAHDDFVRNPKFLAGVDIRAKETVATQCLPEIWKLRASVDALSARVDAQHKPSEHAAAATALPAPAAVSVLSRDVESLLLRIAALGDERVQHLEIIGEPGTRRRDGTRRRRIVDEPTLAKGAAHPKLQVPRNWKADSDAATVNKNFLVLAHMLNEVVLPRIDAVEDRIDERMDRLEKRVDVLSGLFHALNRAVRGEEPPNPLPVAPEEARRDGPGAAETAGAAEDAGETVNASRASTLTATTTTTTTTASATAPPEQAAAAQQEHALPEEPQALRDKPRKAHPSGPKAARAAFTRAQHTRAKKQA